MKKPENYDLQYANENILIELQYGFRKRLTLTVYPDRRVIARVPYGLSKRRVEAYFQKKNNWILKHLEYFEKHPPEEDKKYINGEIHDYLGKEYKLKLISGLTHVKIENDYLLVRVINPNDKEMVAKVLYHWYRKEAIDLLTPRYHEMLDHLQYLELPETTLRFYKMKRRWGSCSLKGVVTLNTELIKKNIGLIDYVIIHEICHLKVPAHNKAFYSLLESIIPDWKKRREALNKNTAL